VYKHCGEWSFSIREQEISRDLFSFLVGVANPAPAVTWFRDIAVRIERDLPVWDMKTLKF
jgi:hypothetical protein